ncbi:MAG: TatD family hydrolase [Ignavibacteria bacterium]|nr:TatD family hydrolase [Ignavibacteria bacterium]
MNKVMELDNFYISFCGNITYKKFNDTDIILSCPESKLLSETDSPFLPPVPYRGKRNEPSYIVNTISKISEIKNTDDERLREKLYSNATNLFFKKI